MIITMIVVVLCLVILGCVPSVALDLRGKPGFFAAFERVFLWVFAFGVLGLTVYEVVSLIH